MSPGPEKHFAHNPSHRLTLMLSCGGSDRCMEKAESIMMTEANVRQAE